MVVLATRLRSSFLEKKPVQLLDSSKKPTKDSKQCQYIQIPGLSEPVAASAASGYKEYPILSLVFFLERKDFDHSKYLQECIQLNDKAPSVSFIDRKDLLQYLTGESESSIYIDGADKQETEKMDVDLPVNPSDLEEIKKILAAEITINDRKSAMISNTSKGYQWLQKYGHDVFISKKMDKNPIQKEAEKSIPIIVVPAAPTALVNMYNAKDLFENFKFNSTDFYMSSGQEKPLKVILNRPKAPPNFPQVYEVVDSTDRFTPNHWKRVVCVIVTGHDWQFKHWNAKKPSEIFMNVKGVYFKYSDEPSKDTIKNWNVSTLTVHRSRRHLDIQSASDFWKDLEEWLLRNKKF